MPSGLNPRDSIFQDRKPSDFNHMNKALILIATLVIIPFISRGQGNDSIQKPNCNNVIRFNPTPMLIWGNLRNITLSYERLIKPNQSLVIQVGYLEFKPVLEDMESTLIYSKRKSNIGVNIALDYRFYPLKRNRFSAPDGLYLGGYLSYYGFKFSDDIALIDTDPQRSGELTAGFNYINLGVELGYQFILWKHFAIDLLIFGPSLTCSITKMNFDGNYQAEDKSLIVEEIKEAVKDKYPYLAPSLDITGENQTLTFRSFFRYSISIGYSF